MSLHDTTERCGQCGHREKDTDDLRSKLAAAERERDEAVRLIGTCAGCGKHTVTVWVCQACYIAMQEESAALRAQVAKLREACDEALNVLIACVVPAGGCDDRDHMLSAQSVLRSVLRETAPEREGADGRS